MLLASILRCLLFTLSSLKASFIYSWFHFDKSPLENKYHNSLCQEVMHQKRCFALRE